MSEITPQQRAEKIILNYNSPQWVTPLSIQIAEEITDAVNVERARVKAQAAQVIIWAKQIETEIKEQFDFGERGAEEGASVEVEIDEVTLWLFFDAIRNMPDEEAK